MRANFVAGNRDLCLFYSTLLAKTLLVSAFAQVTVHESQFPERVRADLIESLRSRKINHKFHYDSIKQTQKWLALHQAYSPSRNDPDCARVYDQAFEAAAETEANRVHLIGLGSGGGQKDTRLLKALRERGKDVYYSPVDVGAAMVLTARQEALKVVHADRCFPLVCDLAHATDLQAAFENPGREGAARFVTFFGMLPNFEQDKIMPRLRSLLRPGDTLLLSANLAPGPDYATGIRKILPLYDNSLTRDWLMTFLFDLGVEAADGEMRFSIEDDVRGTGLKRVEARFTFKGQKTVQIDSERFEFEQSESMSLFFSYRHTPGLLNQILAACGLQISAQWITKSEEEGVFLIRP
jgi:uncharacterized SAM-dependent methyltransferase